MALTSYVFTVNTTPRLLADAPINPVKVTIHNNNHQANSIIYLGGSAVSSSTGFHLDPEATLYFVLNSTEQLFGVAASALDCSLIVQPF
jgi:hypothetical protein